MFASLGLPALAGCFRRAAEPHGRELERVRDKVVEAAAAAVEEGRRSGQGETATRRAKKRGGESSSSSAAAAAIERLRSRLTVVIAAWKLQALLGPGVAVSGGKATVGAAGAGVAAELACVQAEMEGF